ncbi:hypothetical protein G6F43_011537 [Rhizopus delemar]|nr:hypothetical protein G6F43_011537 [Rhizopus delemar]
MADYPVNNEQRTYTEQEVFELLRRFKIEEQTTTQRAREERELPLEIASFLDETTKQQHQDNFKRYKREISKYYHEEWTMAEEINKSFIPKLKQFTVDTTQVVNAHYKGAETSRLHGRAATEIFEQLLTIKSGGLSTEEANQLLDEALESAKRLAIHAWVQGRQQDEEAKDYAIRALRLPPSLKHLEAKESGSKREAFSEEFIARYNEAKYQQRILKAAITNTSAGRGRGGYQSTSTWNNPRGGRGFYGRVTPTILTVQHQQTIQHRERPVSNATQITTLPPQPPSIQSNPTTTSTTNYTIPSDGILPGSRLQHFLPYWKTITNHPWPLSVIQNGYKIQFSKKPIPWRNQKKATTVEDQHHINEAIQKFLDGGMIEISPTQNRQFLSKFFTLQEKTKRRPILDCQKLNSFIQVEHFKMEGVPALRELIEKDDYICKIDLKDAYVVVPMHVDSQDFLSFENEGVAYRYKSLAAFEERRDPNHLLFGRHLHPGEDKTRDEPIDNQRVSGFYIQQQDNADICTTIEDYQPDEEDPTVTYLSEENVQMDSRTTREDDFHDSSSGRGSITYKIPTTGPVEDITFDETELGSNMQIVKYQPSRVTLVGNFHNTEERPPNPKDSSRKPEDGHSCRCIKQWMGNQLGTDHSFRILEPGRENSFNKRTRAEDNFICDSAPRWKMRKLNNKNILGQQDRLKDLAIQIQELCNQHNIKPTEEAAIRINDSKKDVQFAPQPPAANVLDMVNRPSSFSCRCPATSMVTEGDVFISTLETDTLSTEKTSRTKGKAISSSDSIVAQPILVPDDPKDETPTATNYLENKPEMTRKQ